MNQETVCGIIPAAGLSQRMGDFKPLLPLGNSTLIECCVESVLSAGADSVVVVCGYRGEEVKRVLQERFGEKVIIAENEAYDRSDMLQSVKIGLSKLPPCEAFFLLPGDMPVIAEETFRKLLAERMQRKAPVLLPVMDGRRTHPPLIDAGMIPRIMAFEEPGGLRELWNRYESSICYVSVEDRGVLIDADTPEDYLKCVKAFKSRFGKQTVRNRCSLE